MSMEPSLCPHCGEPIPASGLMGLCPKCLLATGEQTQPGAKGSFEPPRPEELARSFPQLEVRELLGRGGMGAVYKALQKELDREIAVKILPPDVGSDPAFALRFTREAKALAKLNHPHIVTLYDFGQTPDGLFYFFMEYVDGVNLRQILDGQRLSPEEALAIVPQICEALQFAHERGIVHRDIKPENLLVGRDGKVKIADFGVAKMVEGEIADPVNHGWEGMTGEGTAIGTLHYMAPEQVNRPGEVDHRADIYSLGVVFYQMLTGELPGRDLRPPSGKVRLDVRLDEVVLKALEESPEQRYQSIGAMKTQLETIAAGPVAASGALRKDGEGKPGAEAAGFWRRAMAMGVDYSLTSFALFPLVMLLSLLAPERIVVEVPFQWFTWEEEIKSETVKQPHEDGSVSVVNRRIIEVRPLSDFGPWRYLYSEVTSDKGNGKTTSRHLLEPRHAISAGNLYLWGLMILWVLTECGPWQASPGKRLLGLYVVDRSGRPPGWRWALVRNGTKVFSVLTLGMGFFMAGWTRHGQALHDLIGGCRVIRGTPPTPQNPPSRLANIGTKGLLAMVLISLPFAFGMAERQSEKTVAERERAKLEKRLSQGRLPLDRSREASLPPLLKLMEEGRQVEATERFLEIQWDTQPLFPAGSALAMREEQWMTLPLLQQEEVSMEVNGQLRALRQLFQIVKKEGAKAALEGAYDRARAYFEGLQALGKKADSPDSTYLLRFLGQSLAQRGQQLLEELEELRRKNLKPGPVVERTLGTGEGTGTWLRFRSGEILEQTSALGEKPPTAESLRNLGLDAMGVMHETLKGLLGWEMVAFPVAASMWDTFGEHAMTLDATLAKMQPGGPIAIAGKEGEPATYIILTRDGSRGILQILDFQDHPPGVRIQYRLLEEEGGVEIPLTPPSVPVPGVPRFQVRAEASPQAKKAETLPMLWEDERLLLEKEILLDEGDVTAAEITGYRLTIHLSEEGRLKFGEATSKYLHRRLALVCDDKIISSPVIQQVIAPENLTLLLPKTKITAAEERLLLEILQRKPLPEAKSRRREVRTLRTRTALRQ